MKIKYFFFLIIFLIFPFLFLFSQKASSSDINCEDRYITLINPVRGRSLWADKTLNPIKDQYGLIEKNDFSATWLLQYDAIKDAELVDEIKEFDDKQELGIFLEVSRDLANDSKVFYLEDRRWSDPSVVFLSGFSLSERKLMIDKVFSLFKDEFGYYPKSVGAWWIDSYSLNYLKSKYKITSSLIVADQLITDSYGIWGQWWGYPYIASKDNILRPSKNKNDNSGVVITQWAQRDLTKAYKEGSDYSNFSLQANDYIRQGKNTDYFFGLINNYLDCRNGIGQITVGLETGMESVGFIKEYENQLKMLSGIDSIKNLSMSEFSDIFRNVYPENPEIIYLLDKESEWNLSRNYRKNSNLNDEINYFEKISFSDYFVKDSSQFLRRYVMDLDKHANTNWFFFWILILSVLFIYTSFKKAFSLSAQITLFIITSYWVLLRSFEKYGWKVFYGPVFKDLAIFQVGTILVSFVFLIFLFKFIKNKKIRNLFYLILPLSFSIDGLLSVFRYSFINEKYFIGTFFDRTFFIGFTLLKGKFIPKIVFERLQTNMALSFLKLNLEDIWSNKYFYLIVYPLIHIFISFLLTKVLVNLSKRKKTIILILMFIFYFLFIFKLLKLDPIAVLPIIK